MKGELTEPQRKALIAARDYGHAFARFGTRGRAGGAYGRMCDRLVERGLLTTAPHQITEAGRTLISPPDSGGGKT